MKWNILKECDKQIFALRHQKHQTQFWKWQYFQRADQCFCTFFHWSISMCFVLNAVIVIDILILHAAAVAAVLELMKMRYIRKHDHTANEKTLKIYSWIVPNEWECGSCERHRRQSTGWGYGQMLRCLYGHCIFQIIE